MRKKVFEHEQDLILLIIEQSKKDYDLLNTPELIYIE